jgi:hypothetical protein
VPESKGRRTTAKKKSSNRGPTPARARATAPVAAAEPATRFSMRPGSGPSPLWVPTLMFSLLLTGVLVIILNYMGALPGGENNKFLLVGIGEVTLGFVAATALR